MYTHAIEATISHFLKISDMLKKVFIVSKIRRSIGILLMSSRYCLHYKTLKYLEHLFFASVLHRYHFDITIYIGDILSLYVHVHQQLSCCLQLRCRSMRRYRMNVHFVSISLHFTLIKVISTTPKIQLK